jgi:transcriptional regulator with XRE-family HTH domain
MTRGRTESPLSVRFGKKLQLLRKEKPLDFHLFVGVSEVSGLATGFLHALESGTKEPCLNTIDILAKSFDLTISELMDGL